MFRAVIFAIIAAFTLVPAAHADGEKSGEFDYYVLSLSWSPTWCALTGDNQGSTQCLASKDFGFILHGLWPQYERGWPAFCKTNEYAPSRGMTGAQADIMGSAGSAWHQWRKHGSCSGLSAAEYYETARAAYAKVTRPPVLRQITQEMSLPAKIIEDAFLDSNPTLLANQITITCKQGRIQEARLCLTKDLEYRKCGRDVIRDCKLKDAQLAPIR